MVILSFHICNGYFILDDDTYKLVFVSINNTFFNTIMYMYKLFLLICFFFIRPNSNLNDLHPDYASTWIKILSCWVCAGLYIWTLVAPILLPDREF
jgi:hypothetical protein